MERFDGPDLILERFSAVSFCVQVVVSALIGAGGFLREEVQSTAQYGCEGYEPRMAWIRHNE